MWALFCILEALENSYDKVYDTFPVWEYCVLESILLKINAECYLITWISIFSPLSLGLTANVILICPLC